MTDIAKELEYLLTHHGDRLGLRPSDSEGLLAAHVGDHVHVVGVLLALERERLRRRVGEAARQKGRDLPRVAIYCPTLAYAAPMIRLAETLAADGICFLLAGHPDAHAILEHPLGAYCGRDSIRQIDFFDIFIVPTVMDCLPDNAVKAVSVHDIFDSPHGDAKEFCDLAGNFDYIFVPSQPAMDLLNLLFARYRPARPLQLVPTGYLRLDLNLRVLAATGAVDRDRIIYAPTVLAAPEWAPYCTAYTCAFEIIEALRAANPAKQIVFRPHPHSTKDPAVRAAMAKASKLPGVVIDTDAADYMPNYARASLLVTDISGTAYTFAFSTLRPVLFVSPAEEQFAGYDQGRAYKRHRADIGAVVTSIAAIPEAVRHLEAHTDSFQRNIVALRQDLVFNVGRAAAAVAEMLPAMARRERRPGAVVCEADRRIRSDAAPARAGSEYYRGFLIRPRASRHVAVPLDLADAALDDPAYLEAAIALNRAISGPTVEDVKTRINEHIRLSRLREQLDRIEERLHALEATVEERTGRLRAAEQALAPISRRAAPAESTVAAPTSAEAGARDRRPSIQERFANSVRRFVPAKARRMLGLKDCGD